MNHPKIKKINTDKNYILIVDFDNGIQKKYDCRKNFEYPAFELLKDEAFFKQAKIDPGGYGISWNDEIDLSEYELWQNGIAV